MGALSISTHPWTSSPCHREIGELRVCPSLSHVCHHNISRIFNQSHSHSHCERRWNHNSGAMVSAPSSRHAAHAAEEEARAEVDVLKSHLDKRAQLTKKIEAQLSRVQGTGKRLNEAVGPLNGETKQLQVFCNST